MTPPDQITPTRLGDYLETMTRAVFQSGISWRVVDQKWPGTRDAFANFDAETVAALTPADVDRLAADARLIRHRGKIEATIANARTLLALDQEPGGFRGYLRAHDDYDALVKDLRGRFRFLGETGCYYFLYVVGEPVPPHDEWQARKERRAATREATR